MGLPPCDYCVLIGFDLEMLCAQPNPPFSAIFEVCERINQSQSAEAVTKEAAQALRKQFKHGNEPERRAAANLWLIMMRNVHAKGFRGAQELQEQGA